MARPFLATDRPVPRRNRPDLLDVITAGFHWQRPTLAARKAGRSTRRIIHDPAAGVRSIGWLGSVRGPRSGREDRGPRTDPSHPQRPDTGQDDRARGSV